MSKLDPRLLSRKRSRVSKNNALLMRCSNAFSIQTFYSRFIIWRENETKQNCNQSIWLAFKNERLWNEMRKRPTDDVYCKYSRKVSRTQHSHLVYQTV